MPEGTEGERGGCGVGDGGFVEFVGVADWEEERDEAAVGGEGRWRDGCDGDVGREAARMCFALSVINYFVGVCHVCPCFISRLSQKAFPFLAGLRSVARGMIDQEMNT